MIGKRDSEISNELISRYERGLAIVECQRHQAWGAVAVELLSDRLQLSMNID